MKQEGLAGVLMELGDYRMAKIVVADAKAHIQDYHLELQDAQSPDTDLVPMSKAIARHFTKRLILITLRVYSKLAGAIELLPSVMEDLFAILSNYSNDETAS